jgi:hypothetical protein
MKKIELWIITKWKKKFVTWKINFRIKSTKRWKHEINNDTRKKFRSKIKTYINSPQG